MSDLENRLRTMLHERAGDVTQVPAHVLELPGVRPHANRRVTWLIAAAVAAVLAVAAAVVATSGNRHRSAPPAVTAPPTVRLPTTAHAVRTAHLSWFGLQPVPGFHQTSTQSQPGLRTIGVRATADHDLPAHCNGCEVVSDWVTVFDAGRFPAAREGVLGWAHTTVNGHVAYTGSMRRYGSHFATKVPSMAWEYRPDAWVLVQGVTPLGARPATLRSLTRAVEPTTGVPFGVPFKLDYVPPLAVTSTFDDRAGGYAAGIHFAGSDLTMDVTVWNGTKAEGRMDLAHAHRRTIAGRPGWYAPGAGFAVAFHDSLVTIEVTPNLDDTVGDRAKADQRLAEARLAVERLMAGIHGTNGDGRVPYLPAEEAIP